MTPCSTYDFFIRNPEYPTLLETNRAAWKQLSYTWEAALDIERVKLGGENLGIIGVLRNFFRVTNGTLHPKMCLEEDESKTTKLSFSSQFEAVQPGVPEHIFCQQENPSWHLQEELCCRERGSSKCRAVVVPGASGAPHPWHSQHSAPRGSAEEVTLQLGEPHSQQWDRCQRWLVLEQ